MCLLFLKVSSRTASSGGNMIKIQKIYIVSLCYSLLLASLLFPSFSYSAPLFEVTAKQGTLTVQDRGIISLPFIIKNNSDKILQLTEKVDLPEGWRLLTSGHFFSLNSGEQTVRLIHVLAPSDTPSGRYTIPYRITSKQNTSFIVEEKISLIVKSHSQLNVEVVNAPSLVLAGETYTVKVRVKNNGNTTVTLDIALRDFQQYVSSVAPKKLSLSPSQESIVIIRATIPNNVDNSSYHKLKLSLQSPSISVDKIINTQVISRIPEGEGKYHLLQSKTTLTYYHNNNNNSLQTELKVFGDLDEAGEHAIDILMRNKKDFSDSQFILDAEKRISYKNTELDAHIGDRSFRLKGIVNTGFYGEGAEINYHPSQKKWNIRAFKAENKQQKHINKSKISGAEVTYLFDDDLEVSANILLKTDADNSQEKEKLVGINTKWYKNENTDIEVSYAQDNDGNAYNIQQNSYLNSFDYNVSLQRYSPLFDGVTKDSKSEQFTGYYRFNNDENYLRSYLSHKRRNLNKDPARQIYDASKVSFGVGHYFDKSGKKSLYTEVFHQTEKDKRQVSDLDNRTQGLKFEYKNTIDAQWALSSRLEYQRNDDQIRQTKFNQQQESLTLSYTPNDKYRMALNVDAAQFSATKPNTLSYGANASLDLNNRQTLSAYWRHSEYAKTNSNSFQINYSYLINKDASLGLSVSKENNNTKDSDINYSLSLSIPLDIPLYKRDDISSVKGKVFDTENNQAIENAIVNIAGQYAVTDKLGNYTFKSVRAGNYTVNTNLDKTNKENYRINDELKQNINLIADKTTLHNIPLSLGSGLSGYVKKYIASNSSIIESKNAKLVPSGGIEGLLITLTSTDDSQKVHKVLTLNEGYFSFQGIKSGDWQVQVSDPQNLIKNFYIQNPVRQIHVQNGEIKALDFRAVPFIHAIKKIGPSTGFSVSSE